MRTTLLAFLALFLGAAFAPAATAAPQKKLDRLLTAFQSGTLEERLASAEGIGAMGKRGAKAVPALVAALNDENPQIVEASVAALSGIGSKAKDTLHAALVSGKYEGEPIPQGPIARALLGMGTKKARQSVEDFVERAPRDEGYFGVLEALGTPGLGYLMTAAADAEHTAMALRSVRRLAAKSVRAAEDLEAPTKGIKDADLKAAVTFCWLQSPTKRDVDVLRNWMRSENPALIETGLWCIGLLGKDGELAAEELLLHSTSDNEVHRQTALWALGGLGMKGPAAPTAAVAASFPGASKAAAKAVAKSNDSDAFVIWRDAGKGLGYQGRVGDKARKYWSLAPAWTGSVTPVPPAPDRTKLPAALLGAESKLIAAARGTDSVAAALASRALSVSGANSEAAMALWIEWLGADDARLRNEALLGLRNIGRGAIEHEATIAALLNDDVTRVAAAQVLTAIATPNSWGAVVAAAASVEGKPPFQLLVAISAYDKESLRPLLPKMRELYGKGHYIMSALMIRFGEEVVDDFIAELGSPLADRRLVAAEALGHLGPLAKKAVPKLQKIKERHPIAQKLLTDALARING